MGCLVCLSHFKSIAQATKATQAANKEIEPQAECDKP